MDKLKKIEIEYKYKIDSTLIKLKLESGLLMEFFYYTSPTHNCQIASIGSACRMKWLSQENLIYIFKNLRTQGIMKNILLLDLNLIYKEEISNILKPLCSKIIDTDYTSSNGNPMTILLCFINSDIYLQKK